MDSLKITVLAGGPSAEREVSLMSGRGVADALASLGHDVALADIAPDELSALDRRGMDVVFPVLHGTWGEDGGLQRVLEDRGLLYVGSGPEASARAMDKASAKEAFRSAGLHTPDWEVRDGPGGGWTGPFPVVVKPVAQGSSVDLTIARDRASMNAAVGAVCGKYGRCLVEQFVGGREMTVGVLGERALPLIEIVVHGHEFYDYQSKYFDDRTEYLFDAALPGGAGEAMAEQALEAHRALGCRDLSRVDFILGSDGRPFILEVNTIPGFTSHSLLPKAAARAGLDFPALCGRLVELAMARAPGRARRARVVNSNWPFLK